MEIQENQGDTGNPWGYKGSRGKRVPGGYKGSRGIQGNQRDAVKQGKQGDTGEPEEYMRTKRIHERTRGLQGNHGDTEDLG